MGKTDLSLFLLAAIAIACLAAAAYAQEGVPPKADFATCTPATVPADGVSFLNGLLSNSQLALSDFTGSGLETQVYSIVRETCPGGDIVHAYFRQSYNGIPILNYDAMMHFRNGILEGSCYMIVSSNAAKQACDNAIFVDFSGIAAQPSINEQRAREIASTAALGWNGSVDSYDSMLAYWIDSSTNQPHLAWVFGQKVELLDRGRQMNANIAVDAKDGSVIFKDSGIRYEVPTAIEQPALPPSSQQKNAAEGGVAFPSPEARTISSQAAGANAGEPAGGEKAAVPMDLVGVAAVAIGAIIAIALAIGAIAVMLKPQDFAVHRALSNEVRAELLSELSDTEKILTDLSEKVGKSKATTLEHLDKLVEAGLIERIETPGKKFVFYRITRVGREALRAKTAA